MATRADVAKRAGVSTSTVSYVLSGVRPISDGTRARVLQAMHELGYTPNVLASGLAGRRSKILALLFPSLPRTIGGSDMEYVVAAADAARERGYHVVLWTTRDGDLDEVRGLAGSGLVDGVLLMEVRLDDERVRFLQSAEVPLALIGRTADTGGMIYADADFGASADLAVRHLAALGHRHVALLNASQRLLDLGYGPVTRMAAAVAAATEAAGLDHVELACEQTVAGGRAAFAAMIANVPAATAVIAFNWEATVGLLRAAAEADMSIPERLSVISFSTAYQAELTFPPLTTVEIPAVGIGRAAVLGLIERLERPDAAAGQVLLAGSLIERGSTARVPARVP